MQSLFSLACLKKLLEEYQCHSVYSCHYNLFFYIWNPLTDMKASQCLQFQSLSLTQRKKHIPAWLIMSITPKNVQMNDSSSGMLFFWCMIQDQRQECKLHQLLIYIYTSHTFIHTVYVCQIYVCSNTVYMVDKQFCSLNNDL